MTGTFKTHALRVDEKPICRSEVVFPVARQRVSVWKQHRSCCGASSAPSACRWHWKEGTAAASSPIAHSLGVGQVGSVRGHRRSPWLCGYPRPHVPGEQEAFAVLVPAPALPSSTHAADVWCRVFAGECPARSC